MTIGPSVVIADKHTSSSVRSTTPGSATRGFMLGLVRSTAGELSCDAEA